MSVSGAVLRLSLCLVLTCILASVHESNAAAITTNTNTAKDTDVGAKLIVEDKDDAQTRHLGGPGNINRPNRPWNRPNRPGYGPGWGGSYWSGGRPQWWWNDGGNNRNDCPPWFRIYGSTYCYKYWRYFENMDPWTARDIVHNTEPWS